MGGCIPIGAENFIFWKVNVGHRFRSSWHTNDGATYGLQNGHSDLLLWTSKVLEKGDKYGSMALILLICTFGVLGDQM